MNTQTEQVKVPTKNTLWKALKVGMNSASGDHTWELGKWYTQAGKIDLCSRGFHASRRVIDAMAYVDMECLAKVEVAGNCIEGENKSVHESMRVVLAWEWRQKDGVEVAIYAAEQVLPLWWSKYPDDERPARAIESAKRWVAKSGKDAAGEAAWAAREAAWAAGEAATWASRDARAAGAATWAAWAARDAAAAGAATWAAWAARAARDAMWALRAAEAATWAAGKEGILNSIEEFIQKKIPGLQERTSDD